jgi:hypothetical protein
MTLFLFDCEGTTTGRGGTGGAVISPLDFMVVMFDDDPSGLTEEGGVEPPYEELRVEEDLVVGTVPFDSFDESLVRKLAFERLRSSLRKVMMLRMSLDDPQDSCRRFIR